MTGSGSHKDVQPVRLGYSRIYDQRMCYIKEGAMTNQLRVWKVLIVLLVSMTSGAIILMSLSAGPLSAGPPPLCVYPHLHRPASAHKSHSGERADFTIGTLRRRRRRRRGWFKQI